jgi:hypothetical protein
MPQNGEKDVTELVRFEPAALQSWTSVNPNATLLYNAPGGTVIVPSDLQDTGRAVAIYNAAGSTVQIQNVSVNCSFCGGRFENQALLKKHNWSAFKRCSVHGMCFGNWDKHNNAHEHTICGVQCCSSRGTDFKSNSAYLAHWRKEHNDHCQAEERRIGDRFCQQCYWQQGISHDTNVSDCKADM